MFQTTNQMRYFSSFRISEFPPLSPKSLIPKELDDVMRLHLIRVTVAGQKDTMVLAL